MGKRSFGAIAICRRMRMSRRWAQRRRRPCRMKVMKPMSRRSACGANVGQGNERGRNHKVEIRKMKLEARNVRARGAFFGVSKRRVGVPVPLVRILPGDRFARDACERGWAAPKMEAL